MPLWVGSLALVLILLPQRSLALALLLPQRAPRATLIAMAPPAAEQQIAFPAPLSAPQKLRRAASFWSLQRPHRVTVHEAELIVVTIRDAPTSSRAPSPSSLLRDPAAATLVQGTDAHSPDSAGSCTRAQCSFR